MRIPTEGDRILFVLRGADPGDNKPAVVRPGVVLSVSSYDAKTACVNAAVKVDGANDETFFKEAGLQFIDGRPALEAWASGVCFDESGKTGTWKYAAYESFVCETMVARGPITHGRETIHNGAEGTWDQLKNTITFKREDVDGLHQDFQAVYPADRFIDQHCARLDAPEGYVWNEKYKQRKGDEELSGDERERMMDDIREHNEWMFEEQHRELLDLLCRKLGLPGYPRSLFAPAMTPWQWPLDYKTPAERTKMREQRRLQNEQERAREQMGRESDEVANKKARGAGGRPMMMDENEDRQTSDVAKQQDRPRETAGSRR